MSFAHTPTQLVKRRLASEVCLRPSQCDWGPPPASRSAEPHQATWSGTAQLWRLPLRLTRRDLRCAPRCPSRRLRPHEPYVIVALWASAATPPRHRCTGLCARARAPHRCPTRACRTASDGSGMPRRLSVAERSLHCSRWPRVLLLMPDKPGYERGALTACVRHLRWLATPHP
ncbi:hypothetical protein NDU88_000763 [Pleurodeles waltl]|uniref:Uncharacterized protein n=1 Tax=Pleurodeles waltl TaxID=8319 RepID=A0AAV7VY97_PLEWA|nr:hypothetical protein NDU88_000763 [Pleurodeles waltl]